MKRQRTGGTLLFWAGLLTGLLVAVAGMLLDLRSPLPFPDPSTQPSNLASLPGAPLPPGTGPGGSQGPDSTGTPQAAKPVTVLLLGVDERATDGGRSDTMLLMRITDQQVRLLSVPRDTLVTLKGYGESKINAAYAYGGPELAVQTVADLLGVGIDYYVKVNTAGFSRLVDLIGGVPFDVPTAMHYEDPTDGLVIDLKPGPQVLDGQKAEEFVRFRYDGMGDDLGRIHRQQEFLKAAAAKALTPANWLRLPQLLYTGSQYVETSVPLTLQVRLAQSLYAAAGQDALLMETLPGHGTYKDGISYFVVDQAALGRLLSLWHPPS